MNYLSDPVMEIVNAIASVKSRDKIGLVLRTISEKMPVQYISYRSFVMARAVNAKPIRFSTFPIDWFAHYLSLTERTGDAFLKACRFSVAPREWSELERTNPYMAEIFKVARQYDISPVGLSCPVHGPRREMAILSYSLFLSLEEWENQKSTLAPALQIVSTYLHQAMIDTATPSERDEVTLSAREVECVSLAAIGSRAKQIAAELGLAEQTVNFHLNLARRKLGAANTTEAAVRATELGLLDKF